MLILIMSMYASECVPGLLLMCLDVSRFCIRGGLVSRAGTLCPGKDRLNGWPQDNKTNCTSISTAIQVQDYDLDE